MRQTRKAPEYLAWELDDACAACPESWLGSFELREHQHFQGTKAANASWRKSPAELQGSSASFPQAGQGCFGRGHRRPPCPTLRWRTPSLRGAPGEARKTGLPHKLTSWPLAWKHRWQIYAVLRVPPISRRRKCHQRPTPTGGVGLWAVFLNPKDGHRNEARTTALRPQQY